MLVKQMLLALFIVGALFFAFGCPFVPPPPPPVNITPPVNVTPPDGTNATPPEPPVNVTPPDCGSPVPPEAFKSACEGRGGNVIVLERCPYQFECSVPEKNDTQQPPANVTPPEPPSTSDKITKEGLKYSELPEAALNIYFIDVGYGDAILLKKGDLDILIDAGDAASGEKVAQFLRQYEIDDIEIAVATDPALHNIGGMPAVLDAFVVEQFWDNGVVVQGSDLATRQTCGDRGCTFMSASSSSAELTAAYTSLMKSVEEKGLRPKHPVARDELEMSGIKITVLNPNENRLGNSPNADSIALKVENGNFCAILAGDVEEMVEAGITALGVPLRCQVLKASNHAAGSSNSFQLINSVQPESVIISVGPNDANAPNPTTLERFRLLGNAKIYRTDYNGTITLVSDGSAYSVYGNR